MPQATQTFEALARDGYAGSLDPRTLALLIESSSLSENWSESTCLSKPTGGMEEWAKDHHLNPNSCAWYHGTWQYLRLLDMVAVPHWHRDFYNRALGDFLRRTPHANVLISAAADYGMLASLHEAMQLADAHPTIVVYDICETPLKSCRWYAEKHGLEISTKRENLLAGHLAEAPFDLIVTDEFLTVLKSPYKPQITRRWKELLKPGGSVVTVAMMGGETTPELRRGYGDRARTVIQNSNGNFLPDYRNGDKSHILARIQAFADFHTRHMISNEAELNELLSIFDHVYCHRITTPGECVNPTDSFQIVASLRE